MTEPSKKEKAAGDSRAGNEHVSEVVRDEQDEHARGGQDMTSAPPEATGSRHGGQSGSGTPERK